MKKKDQLQLFWIIIFVSVGVFFLLSLVYGQTEEFKYDPQIGIDKQLGKFEISEKYSLMSSEIEGCELVDYYNTGDDGARDNYQTASRRLAQVFTASETYTLCSVKLKMYGAGGDAGDIQISIKEVDGNNKPTGSDISSGTYTEQLPQGSGAADWIEISMSEIELQNETQYAIIVYAPDITGEIYVAWNDDETSPEYTGGIIRHRLTELIGRTMLEKMLCLKLTKRHL